MKKIDQSDIMYLIGLPLLGAGLFYVFGPGWAMVGAGVTFILLGFFGDISH